MNKKLKWLWKNKKDEDQTVIRNKARLVAKGLCSEKRVRVMWLNLKLCTSNVGMRTPTQIRLQTTTKLPGCISDSQSAIAISSNPDHTHGHSTSILALPEDTVFKYLRSRIGMRCLTPAELEVLTNETA
ncbi:hypothetical protein Tco_0335816 [Tanacetum coccineum]